MGVDQLLVNPVAAALRKLVDVQLARGEHHLASHALDFVAIDVDVGKVVVGADFLNLTQRVLERAPVPQPDVLKRSLIIRRVGRRNVRLSGKLALRDSVQSVGLPRQFDVVGDIGLLANQFVRFHDKAADVPGDYLKGEITDRGGKNRRDKPAPAWRPHSVGSCDQRAQSERPTDDEHPCERDVRVSVGHTPEDRMFIEQSLESTEIHTHRED